MDAGQPLVDSRRWSVAKSIPRNQDLIKRALVVFFLFIKKVLILGLFLNQNCSIHLSRPFFQWSILILKTF